MLRFLCLTLICTLTLSCISKKDATIHSAESLVDSTELYDSFLDVAYGDAQGTANLLDAYLPKQRDRNTKVIVYIHGGGWKYGDKQQFPKKWIAELVGKRKYVLVSINYRLINDGQNSFPEQIDDIKKALAFLSSHAIEYRYNGDSFALIGASAGAHLALLYAYGYDGNKLIKTVVDIFGPTDLTDPTVRKPDTEINNIIEEYLAVNKNDSHFAKQASPYFRLTADSAVPTLIFHGTVDELVPVNQSEKLHAKLEELKIPVQMNLYPGKGHEFTPDMAADISAKMMSWLNEYYPADKL